MVSVASCRPWQKKKKREASEKGPECSVAPSDKYRQQLPP